MEGRHRKQLVGELEGEKEREVRGGGGMLRE